MKRGGEGEHRLSVATTNRWRTDKKYVRLKERLEMLGNSLVGFLVEGKTRERSPLTLLSFKDKPSASQLKTGIRGEVVEVAPTAAWRTRFITASAAAEILFVPLDVALTMFYSAK